MFKTVIFSFIVGAIAGLISGIYANSAAIDEGGREEGIGKKAIWMFAGINSLLLGLSVWLLMYPATFVLISVLLIGLQAINQEGKKREASWNTLILIYGIALVFAIAKGWDKSGPKFWQLWLLLFPIAAWVVGMAKARLINEYNRGSKKAEPEEKPKEPKAEAAEAKEPETKVEAEANTEEKAAEIIAEAAEVSKVEAKAEAEETEAEGEEDLDLKWCTKENDLENKRIEEDEEDEEYEEEVEDEKMLLDGTLIRWAMIAALAVCVTIGIGIVLLI